MIWNLTHEVQLRGKSKFVYDTNVIQLVFKLLHGEEIKF